ncbi:hypothetical protein BC941DRAFT_513220 [Chlamydoabsidia padenii]|nr:hypothetical protein BC941DRAFT_513220 [Chlamydoabsidia padenii]
MSTENPDCKSTLTFPTTTHSDESSSQQPGETQNTDTPTTPNHDTPTEEEIAQDSAKKAKLSIESNQDYQAVVKVLNVLKHQLQRANKDIETLTRMKKEALEDPFGFVLDLKSKKKLKRRPPPLQRILSVPELDWTKYRFIPESRYARQTASLAALTHRYTHAYKSPRMFKTILDNPSPMERGTIKTTVSRETRMLQRELAKGLESVGQLPSSSRAGSAVASEASDASDDDRSVGKSQRRVSSQTGPAEKSLPMVETSHQYMKPPPQEVAVATHNQPWTDEEQQRLEQLLEIYPDEPVQAQRFNKIAAALGTRTARQVGSRIQKYFIKLAKMGLPVPGRVNLPSTTPNVKSGRGRGGRQKVKVNRKPKTPGYNVMVSNGATNTKISGGYYSSSTVPTVYMSEDEDMDVKKTMRQVNHPDASGTDTVIHEGFACDSCGVEPIVGVLYKCTVCDEAEEVDLCSKCMAIGTFTNDQHSLDHTFEAVRTAAAPYYADNDYASPEHLGEYSYLGY